MENDYNDSNDDFGSPNWEPPQAFEPTSPSYQEIIEISSDDEIEDPNAANLRNVWLEAMAFRQHLISLLDSNLEYLEMLTQYRSNYFPDLDF